MLQSGFEAWGYWCSFLSPVCLASKISMDRKIIENRKMYCAWFIREFGNDGWFLGCTMPHMIWRWVKLDTISRNLPCCLWLASNWRILHKHQPCPIWQSQELWLRLCALNHSSKRSTKRTTKYIEYSSVKQHRPFQIGASKISFHELAMVCSSILRVSVNYC